MKRGWIYLLIIALVGTGLWGYNQYQENIQTNILLENQFQRMFQTMISDVENIQVNLGKIMVTGTPKQNVMLFSDIMRLCYDAQEKLNQLPIDHGNVSKTQKFLSQVGDLCTALARKNLEDKPLTEKEMNILQELHNYSNYLSQQLISLQADIVEKGMKIGELRKRANRKLDKTNKNIITTSFVKVEERMQEYPELIYDGPFSEHIQKQKPYLTGRKINQDELKEIAEKFVGNGVKYEAMVIGDIDDIRIPVYVVELKPANTPIDHTVTMGITKTGGKVMWMLNTKEIKNTKITEKQGVAIAQNFLKRRGYENMIPTYSIKYDGQMLINFAYSENDVVIYSDLIKVKVALDEGDIVGFESEGYLFNHHKRKIGTPEVDVNEARNRISLNVDVSEPRLAIIPTEGGREVLCYEFKARFSEDTFLIYINADTGEEEKILQVIIKDEGVLML